MVFYNVEVKIPCSCSMQQVQFTEEEDAAAKVATVAQKDGSNDGSVGHLRMLEYWKNLLVLENN